jgi:hypothetical protein
MRYFNKIGFIVCLLLFSIFNANAQVGDLLNQKNLEFESKYLDLKGTDINYPVIKGLKDTVIQKKLNARFKQIFIDQIETDSFRFSLFKELKNNMEIYNTIVEKELENENRYEQTEENYTPPYKIEDVNFTFLSYLNSTLSVMQIISYKVEDRNLDIYEEDFYSYRLFYFNVLNGKEYKPADVFKKSAEKQINQLIEQKVKEKLNQVDFKELRAELLDVDEEEEVEVEFYKGVKNALSFKNKGLENFSAFKEGFAFPKVFSMAFYIPAWSKCTQDIYGMNMAVRLTFDEIRNYLNPEGPFASLITFQLRKDTQLKNQNQPTYKQERNEPEFTWTENIPIKISDNLKKITIKLFNTPSDKADTTKGRNFIEIEYYKNGNLKEVNEIQSKQSTLFTYDNAGRIIKKVKYRNGKTEESFDYVYDEKGNVKELKSLLKEQYIESTFYHYVQNRMFKEHYNFSNLYEEFSDSYEQKTFTESGLLKQQTYYGIGHGNGVSANEYEYDKNKRLLLSYTSSKENPDYAYYVYDESGNLITKDFDRGSHLIECQYDKRNNLIKQTHYNSRNVSERKIATYDENNRILNFEKSQNNYNSLYYTLSYEMW